MTHPDDATELLSVEVPTYTAAEMIKSGFCSSECMLAFNGFCDCRCDGRWHGFLSQTTVTWNCPVRNDWIDVETATGRHRVQVDLGRSVKRGWEVHFGTTDGFAYEVVLPIKKRRPDPA